MMIHHARRRALRAVAAPRSTRQAALRRVHEQPLYSVRQFATPSQDSAAYEFLKRDFRKWVGREVQLLAAMAILGTTGVYLYQNRENAPSKRVASLLDSARDHAKSADRQGALKDCLQAYTIVKSTNPQDRHLFELAFTIAAQYETVGNIRQATRYYLDALSNAPYIRESHEQIRSRLVVLDRIAQCYQDQGEHRAAENYYRQSVEVYDKSKPTATSNTASHNEQLDMELPGVLFNYGQFLMHQKRWEDAERVLRRALSAATAASLSQDYVVRIERLLTALQITEDTEGDEDDGSE